MPCFDAACTYGGICESAYSSQKTSVRSRYICSQAASLIVLPWRIITIKSDISLGVVCPHPYSLYIVSRPSVRAFTRVFLNPFFSNHVLISAPPPASFSHHTAAVLSLCESIREISVRSSVGVESLKNCISPEPPRAMLSRYMRG